jgi:hypothetical protein
VHSLRQSTRSSFSPHMLRRGTLCTESSAPRGFYLHKREDVKITRLQNLSLIKSCKLRPSDFATTPKKKKKSHSNPCTHANRYVPSFPKVPRIQITWDHKQAVFHPLSKILGISISIPLGSMTAQGTVQSTAYFHSRNSALLPIIPRYRHPVKSNSTLVFY